MMNFRKKKDDADIKRINKKGIFLTCVIVVGILGASFIVWLLPSENVQTNRNGNMILTFSDPNETLTSVNSQFALLQDEVQNQISKAKTDQINLTYINNFVNTSISQNNQLMMTLLNGNPSQSLMPDYVDLMNDLKNFSTYLSDIKNVTLTSTNVTNDLKKLNKL